MSETPKPWLLEYRLIEADVRHYHASGRARKCWHSCRRRKWAYLLLAALVVFFVGTCFHAHGVRSGSIALGTILVVVAGLSWSREVRAGGCIHRLAGPMGLPRDVRLVVSPEGIAEEADDPSRTFAWSEVVALDRVDHLSVIRLRTAGAVLIVPDSAFASTANRVEFETTIQAWRGEALAKAGLDP